MRRGFRTGVIFLTLVVTVIIGSCKKKDPTILKVFVRTKANELVGNAKVVVIGDKYSNPPTREYVDTALTNASGYAEFNMDPYFEGAHKDSTLAYFNIVVKKNTDEGEGYVQCRAHLTSVQTVYYK